MMEEDICWQAFILHHVMEIVAQPERRTWFQVQLASDAEGLSGSGGV